jgi:hypothetical protein
VSVSDFILYVIPGIVGFLAVALLTLIALLWVARKEDERLVRARQRIVSDLERQYRLPARQPRSVR